MKCMLVALVFCMCLVPVLSEVSMYKLAMVWPVSYCTSNTMTRDCIEDIPNYFTIHGLWIYESRHQEVNECSIHEQDAYDDNEVDDIIDDLRMYWGSLTQGYEWWLRNHEWESHGKYSGLDLMGYFSLGLELYNKLNIRNCFYNRDKRIIPDAKKGYYAWEFTDVIETETGSRPNIECNTYQDNKYQLYQVILCFDKHKNFMDCPLNYNGYAESNCHRGKRNRFPSFTALQ